MSFLSKPLLVAAALLPAVAAEVPAAAAAPYSKTATFACTSSYCTASFPAVPAGKRLAITFVSCHIQMSAVLKINQSALGLAPLAPGGTLATARVKSYLAWSQNPGTDMHGTLSQPVAAVFGAGTAPEIFADAPSSIGSGGSCAINGNLN